MLITRNKTITYPQSIKSFLNEYVGRDILIIYGLIFLIVLTGCIYMIANTWTYQYLGFHYIPPRWFILMPCIFALSIFAVYVQRASPFPAYVIQTYGMIFAAALSFEILVTGIQYTPFPTIDLFLVKVDQFLGFSTPALISWTAKHSVIKEIFTIAYNFLGIELIAIPFLLPFFKNKEALSVFFMAILIAFLVGTTIYYFFPTASPVSVLHSQYFSADEHDTSLKFYQIHHYKTTITDGGGMIAFPSFHVIWAIILTYATKTKRWLFIPLMVVNAVLIVSTLFLGWHYLTDVFAGFILAGASIATANFIYHRYCCQGLEAIKE